MCEACGCFSSGSLCPRCRGRILSLHADPFEYWNPPYPVWSFGFYDSLSRYILDFKYRKRFRLAEALGELMGSVCSLDFSNCCLVPVPVSPARLRQRGYNQALLLAKGFSRSSGAPVVDCLVKLDVSASPGLSKDERFHNVSRSISYLAPLHRSGARILIIDDVLTTGSTYLACAAALPPGALVGCAVLARGVFRLSPGKHATHLKRGIAPPSF